MIDPHDPPSPPYCIIHNPLHKFSSRWNGRSCLSYLILWSEITIYPCHWCYAESVSALREMGIVYAHENCYGWNGPWAHRSEWQQISDAVTGVSLEFGRAMGLDEPITPIFPNSDFCTGVSGAMGILDVLIQRGEKGESYVVDVAINYYNRWFVNSRGTYPPEIWDDLWSCYDHFVFRSSDNTGITIPAWLQWLRKKKTPGFDEKYFELRKNAALGIDVRTIKLVLNFVEGGVEVGYNVGSRPNGMGGQRIF
ncbi:hypothetical protein AN958_04556 [Leucoagaricus sp. SymC.cos]|nr:hypothetical protein AN958_04556 [Leucoagaricus sp. SymC.cos]